MVKTGYILNRIFDQARNNRDEDSKLIFVKLLTPKGIKTTYVEGYDAEYIIKNFKKGDEINFELVAPEFGNPKIEFDGCLKNVI